ncbi:hypothetical protein L6452_20727 [Arctium lappa]|uniref:Uncharacterized protein n=1 Tax=Arctium lappa TaxID=4217 RepID=A0ACB9BBM9_ARCLA|nr:hypothetical protein L6452_20727 [Arctium lappa]
MEEMHEKKQWKTNRHVRKETPARRYGATTSDQWRGVSGGNSLLKRSIRYWRKLQTVEMICVKMSSKSMLNFSGKSSAMENRVSFGCSVLIIYRITVVGDSVGKVSHRCR